MSGELTIVGLGSGELDQLTLGIYRILKEASNLFIRTEDHPVVQTLKDEGLEFKTFDDVYERYDRFEEVYEDIANQLIDNAEQKEVVYAVPGHPLVAEKTVQLLFEKGRERGVEIKVEGGQSFLDPLFTALRLDPIEGFQFLDALAINSDELLLNKHLIICQIYDGLVASDVKISLLEQYSPEHLVTLVQAAGDPDQTIKTVPLSELDYEWTLDNRTSLYVPPIKEEQATNHSFPRLKSIIRALRAPGGCPWDQEQTHESLKRYLVEETYEVLQAIDEQDDEHLVEELGDVLLQVMLHAQIGEDEGFFNIYDIIRTLSDKMVRRHPHVFSDTMVGSTEDVLVNWDQIKAQENKGQKRQEVSILDNVEKGLPPLLFALELQKKASEIGFDWPSTKEVWNKIYEELKECQTEEESGDMVKLESEIGDVLFSVVNLSRKHGIDPALALISTNQKFRHRFSKIEESASVQGKAVESLTLGEMEALWQKAKGK